MVAPRIPQQGAKFLQAIQLLFSQFNLGVQVHTIIFNQNVPMYLVNPLSCNEPKGTLLNCFTLDLTADDFTHSVESLVLVHTGDIIFLKKEISFFQKPRSQNVFALGTVAEISVGWRGERPLPPPSRKMTNFRKFWPKRGVMFFQHVNIVPWSIKRYSVLTRLRQSLFDRSHSLILLSG
jgi:hypothetical protein